MIYNNHNNNQFKLVSMDSNLDMNKANNGTESRNQEVDLDEKRL